MPRRLVRRERDSSKLDRVAVVQDPAHVRGRVRRHRTARRQEVGATAAFDHVGITIHDQVLRVRLAQDFGRPAHVVEVRLPVEQELGV